VQNGAPSAIEDFSSVSTITPTVWTAVHPYSKYRKEIVFHKHSLFFHGVTAHAGFPATTALPFVAL